MFEEVVKFIRKRFNADDPEQFIPLHEPRFVGNERKYVMDAIDSTFVSSVGEYVNRFEKMMTEITGAKYAIATGNGTAALHVALLMAGVERGDEVITQPLSFIATCNAISYIGAEPVFVDVDKETLGMSAQKLYDFLKENAEVKTDGFCYNKITGKRIKACVPMHTFGFPAEIDSIAGICEQFNIILVEDAAESLGSTYKGKHTGTFGLLGTYSFNGNKTVTCGGGGALVTDSEELAKKAKHITTTAKVPHRWNFYHDMTGYNYRMPNLNAAMACAQLEMLNGFIENKRQLADEYYNFFNSLNITLIKEKDNCYSNYWLNAILLKDKEERDEFLQYTNDHNVMTRPSWALMNTIPMFKSSLSADISNAEWLENRLVNIPSSVTLS